MLFIVAVDAATKIQGAFRNHQARTKLKSQTVWKIHEKLEYSSEQTEGKVRKEYMLVLLNHHLKFLLYLSA